MKKRINPFEKNQFCEEVRLIHKEQTPDEKMEQIKEIVSSARMFLEDNFNLKKVVNRIITANFKRENIPAECLEEIRKLILQVFKEETN
jgi:hypothetical protein